MKYLIILLFPLIFCLHLGATKIKDISSTLGVRDNQLTGYGLVIGLNGSGDRGNSKFTMQSIANMLETMNIKIHPNDIQSRNVAAVIVSAKLPPFSRAGDKVDVFISSIGDAKSLEGGTLIMTPLNAIDGNIYAVAQGNITGGIGTQANISRGAIIERELIYDLYNKQNASLSLLEADFKNAVMVEKTINNHFKERVAVASDPRTIKLIKPKEMTMGMVEFLSIIKDLDVNYERGEKIIIDERNSTIISGSNISIQPVSINHNDINISINNDSPTISSLVYLLQQMGLSAKHIISILQAMHKAGAISAEIELI